MPDARLIDRWNGFVLMISSFAVGRQEAPESSRLMPNAVCVKSLVPKLKDSAVCAISSAVKRAPGQFDHRPDEVAQLGLRFES